ncbi:AGAP002415-PA-like protein [Anopheles sinensis]|uniref:AGAP002415-PA-like protein n=1 Tax=Anopheles sinensis TaxID=74873 RepID=A0A084VSE6_ANOSI|nr:AGAP002415-PA-like protein [Anopheles sinensis]
MDSYLGLAESKLKPRSVVDAFSNRTGTVKKRPVRAPPPQAPKPRSVSQASTVVDSTAQFHYLLDEHRAVVEKNKRLEMRNSLLEEENTKLKSDIDSLRGAYEELQENLGSGTSRSFDTGKLLVHLKLKRRADKETLEKRNIIKSKSFFVCVREICVRTFRGVSSASGSSDEACFNTYLQHVDMVETLRIPRVIHECVTVLDANEKFMRTTGLYRMSGNHKEIQKLRYAINAGDYKALRKQKSPHEVCGILKLFLRELKDPLIPLEACNRIIPSVWLGSPKWRKY